MPFVRERDDLPWEARLNASATFRYWPKLDGRNIVASPTAGHCRYAVRGADGSSILGETNVTPTTVAGVSRLDLAIPAIATLGERLQVRIWFRETGGAERYDMRTFDVVLHPFGQPWTSRNDILEMRPDADTHLDRIGQRLGYAAGDEAKIFAAAICAIHGRIALEARIRDTIGVDRSSSGRLGAGFTRPALIIDRQRLARVERYETMAHLYRSVAQKPEDGDDPASQLFRHFRDSANTAWAQVGPLGYDADQNGVPDTVISDVTRVFRFRRAQG